MILIPKGAALDFHSRFEKTFNDWQEDTDRQIHVVKAGDNLSTIAEYYNVPLPVLLIWNGLNPRNHIHPGDRLIIYSRQPATEEGSR